MSSAAAGTVSLSEYEKIRAGNIERNNARLRELGLISALEQERSNAAAWGRPVLLEQERSSSDEEQSDEEWSDNDQGDSSPQRKLKRRNKLSTSDGNLALHPSSPSRKSRRLQGLTPEAGNFVSKELMTKEDVHQERQNRVQECRLARLKAAKIVADATGGYQKAATENPTATYNHCLMRVCTMTDKALGNRVKAIERAAGKHCVVKMAIFKSCLQDEDKWELAKLASDALERLKELQAPPE